MEGRTVSAPTPFSQNFLWPLIEERAERTPDALFAVDERERQMTFGEYREAGLRCAAGLQTLGVAAATVVSWQLPTTFEALILVAGLARCGAVQNPILPILREREVSFITEQTEAAFLFVPRVFRGFDFEAMARAATGERGTPAIHVIDDGLPDGDPGGLAPFVAPDNDDPPVRWILYSSGTTADPKGARHTDLSVAGPGRAMVGCFEATAADRHAFVFPFTHIGGLNWLFAGLIAGFAHVCVEAFKPPETIDFMAEHGVTLAGAGTAFHHAYLAAQQAAGPAPVLPAVRCYPGGGAPKPPQLFFELEAATGAPIVSGYGLTEHPIAVMGNIRDPHDKLAHTEGRATPGTEIRVVKADETIAAVGEEGEVRVRGPHLFRGYVDSSLDAAAFDSEGFLRTGDLGSFDEGGWLTITGRLKDVIIRKGENISAKEVEDHLYEHPKVHDVTVIGLPDEARGELVCAIVVAPDALGFDEMANFLKERGLMLQKIPERLEHLDEIPRNPSGKVLKRDLQQRFG